MSTYEMDLQKRIFADNLRKYLERAEKTQTDLQKFMGVSSSTVSDWMHGAKMPRMDKVQSICNWLGIQKSDLLEEKNDTEGYYVNPETAKVAQEILDNKELSMLFDVSRDISPEDLKVVYQMVLALKRKEQGD